MNQTDRDGGLTNGLHRFDKEGLYGLKDQPRSDMTSRCT